MTDPTAHLIRTPDGLLVASDCPHAIRRVYDFLMFDGILRPNEIYVEIGAHRARFLRESGLLNVPAFFYLIEPNPEAMAWLIQWRRACSNRHRIFLSCVAVASPPATATPIALQTPEADEGACQLTYRPDVPVENRVTVGCRPLADIIAGPERIRFLAINAEQAEYEILKSPSLARCDFVTVEFHPGKSGIDTREFFNEYLADTFRLVAFARDGEPYNILLVENKHVPLTSGI